MVDVCCMRVDYPSYGELILSEEHQKQQANQVDNSGKDKAANDGSNGCW